MPTDEDFNWRRQCYGRHELLKKLQDAYRLADAQVPQFVVLKGIPGVGKTRIVQEFYRWLSTVVDTRGYWPDLLISEATKDRVNPIFDERNRCPIPFLWLGVKFDEPLPAPSQGNAETSPRIGTSESGKALRDAMPHLMPHTIEAITKRE
ncbi:MAG: ATP-binding protein, partial [Planctomycetota bacterium]